MRIYTWSKRNDHPNDRLVKLIWIVYSKLDLQRRKWSFTLHTPSRNHPLQCIFCGRVSMRCALNHMTTCIENDRNAESTGWYRRPRLIRFECSCLLCIFTISRVNCVYWVTDCNAAQQKHHHWKTHEPLTHLPRNNVAHKHTNTHIVRFRWLFAHRLNRRSENEKNDRHMKLNSKRTEKKKRIAQGKCVNAN